MNNSYILFFIIIILLIIASYGQCLLYNNDKITINEGFSGSLDELKGKEISLTYIGKLDDDNNKYLAISSLGNCEGAKQDFSECPTDVAYLAPSKDINTRFFVMQNKAGQFSLLSVDRENSNLILSQALKLTNLSNYLCFGNDVDESIQFLFEEATVNKQKGFRIKFNDNYVGVCSEIKCGNFPRLCLYDDSSKAAIFSITVENSTENKINNNDNIEPSIEGFGNITWSYI